MPRVILLFAVVLVIGAVSLERTRSTTQHLLDQVAFAATPKSPEFVGEKSDWLNTSGGKSLKLYGDQGVLADDPLAPGKHPIVLVDFWEYTCVNCLNTLPYVKEWQKLYQPDGLVIIGIHTPEFKFGHDPANVARAVKHLGITYPVLVDSDFNNWNNFNNESWPADYVLDSRGHIVSSHIGEGDYAQSEQELRHLLLKANPGETLPPAYGDPADANSALMTDLTPELYAGSSRGQIQNPEGFGNGETIHYASISPDNWSDGSLVMSGRWSFDGEYAQHVGTDASDYVGVKYHAKDCVAVIKPDTAEPITVTVTQDGAPVTKANAGADIRYAGDGSSYLLVDAPREYQITRNAVPGEHNIALYPVSDKFSLYSFCFSGI